MSKVKKIISVFLIMIMVLSLAACGKDKKNPSQKDNESVEKNEPGDSTKEETVLDCINKMTVRDAGSYEKGFRISITDNDNKEVLIQLSNYGVKSKNDYSAAAKIVLKGTSEGYDIDLNTGEFLSFIGDKFYVDFSTLARAISGEEKNVGVVELDRLSAKENDAFGELFRDFLNAVLKDTNVTKKDDTYYATFSTASELKELLQSTVNFFNNNRDKLNEEIKKSIDGPNYDEYIKGIVATNGEDIVNALSKLGINLSKEQLDEIVTDISLLRIEGTELEALDKFFSYIDVLSGITDEQFAEAEKKGSLAVFIEVKNVEDSTSVKISIQEKNEVVSKGIIDVFYTFNSKDILLTKPEKTSSLVDIAENIIGFAGLKESFGSVLEKLNDIFGTSERTPVLPETDPEEKIEQYSYKSGSRVVTGTYNANMFKMVTEEPVYLEDKDGNTVKISTIDGINYKEYTKELSNMGDKFAGYQFASGDFASASVNGFYFSVVMDPLKLTTIVAEIDGGVLMVEVGTNNAETDVSTLVENAIRSYTVTKSE